MKCIKGPWNIVVEDGFIKIQFATQNENLFKDIALVYRRPDLFEEREAGLLTGLANANLIAAAPELLEIAELILKEWEKPTEGILPGELIARLSQYSDRALKAVAKARGES